MASVVSESQDRSRPLSLSMDHLASSSPFPSPSSSFVPPPVPGAHEFAVPTPHTARGKKFPNAKKESDDPRHSSLSAVHNKSDQDSSNAVDLVRAPHLDSPSHNSSTSKFRSPTSPTMSTSNGTPTTPTPIGVSSQTERRQSHSSSVSLGADELNKLTLNTYPEPTTPTSPFSQPNFRQPLTPSSRHSRDSLVSNRPAPPSPEITRRVSGAPSISSNRSRSGISTSRPASTALSRTGSKRLSSRQSTQPTPAHGNSGSVVSASTRRPRSLIIKIRDFAFPTHDERHEGLGPDVPRPNRVRVLNRIRRGGSVSSVASSEGEDEEEEGGIDDGWGVFKWGTFSWSSGKASGNGSHTEGYVPSSTDFARNFDAEGSDGGDADEEGDYEYGTGEMDDGDEGRFLLGDEPLYPGLYRAMYAFVPESASEMALEEDQVVRVVGRGGGVGWAIVVRSEADGGGHALVPESYLEIVQLDEEAEGD